LPGTRKLVDQFDIQSAPRGGTTVTMELWKREATI
jgi:anti-sigma regulatory factor (Ser/Thr protein kinase)